MRQGRGLAKAGAVLGVVFVLGVAPSTVEGQTCYDRCFDDDQTLEHYVPCDEVIPGASGYTEGHGCHSAVYNGLCEPYHQFQWSCGGQSLRLFEGLDRKGYLALMEPTRLQWLVGRLAGEVRVNKEQGVLQVVDCNASLLRSFRLTKAQIAGFSGETRTKRR